MADSKCGGDCIGYFPEFDDEDEAACDVLRGFEEPGELFVHLVAYSTLRAMLENKNRMGFGMLEKSFEILLFSYFRHHDFRLAD